MATLPRERGLHKSGYVEVKQSSKVKGRKLKTWKRKWIVVHQMSDLASGTYAAKVDVFNDEEASKTSRDKMTFFLDHVTGVQHSTSKTHPHAFEIVESDPTLVFCADGDVETLEWMNMFKRIFFPDDGEFGRFDVSVLPNQHSTRLNLEGKYVIAVTTSDVSLQTSDKHVVIKWDLSQLKKFFLDSEPNANQRKVLVIESGPNSYTGEGVFRFLSQRAETILTTIRLCIQEAVALRQQQRLQGAGEGPRDRTVSFTASERNFRVLLDDTRPRLETRGSRTESVLSSSSSVSSAPYSPKDWSPPPLPPIPNESPSKSRSPFFPRDQAENKGKLVKNSSVPNMPALANEHGGYSSIPIEKVESGKLRTMSLTSRDSGISVPDMDGRSPSDRVRKLSTEKRCFSNSFDSAVSNGSNEDSRRKFSDVEEPIHEESDKTPIYNSIDDKGGKGDHVENGKSFEDKPRRHSSGEQKKEKENENEYEDLEKFQKGKSSTQMPGEAAEVPPALPARPPKLRLRHASGSSGGKFRHSCMAKIDQVKPEPPKFRRSSSAEAIGEVPARLSRSNSKDLLYASIPDLRSRNSSEALVSGKEVQADTDQADLNQVDPSQWTIDIFSPSVQDWVIGAGTPPATNGFPPLNMPSPILPSTPFVNNGHIPSNVGDPPPSPPQPELQVDDLLGLEFTSTEDPPVTKPEDLLSEISKPEGCLLDLDPFETNNFTNDLLTQDGGWDTSCTGSEQESPYMDMSATHSARTSKFIPDEDPVYVAVGNGDQE